MKKIKKDQQSKSDKTHKPEAHVRKGKGIEKDILGEATSRGPGSTEQKRKLKAR
jgi:hypothetical protein